MVALARCHVRRGELDDAQALLGRYKASGADAAAAATVTEHVAKAKTLQAALKPVMSRGTYRAGQAKYVELSELCPESYDVAVMGVTLYHGMKNLAEAIRAGRRAIALNVDDLHMRARVSDMMSNMGDFDQAFDVLKECRKTDSDFKPCSQRYRSMKKWIKLLEKGNKAYDEKNFDDAVEAFEAVLDPAAGGSDGAHRKASGRLCTIAVTQSQWKRGATMCERALKLTEAAGEAEDANAVRLQLASCYEKLERWTDAMKMFNAVFSATRSEEARQGLERCQYQQKLAERKDWYKILGVSNKATKKELKKAYNKKTKELHPDRAKTEEDRVRMEDQYMDVNRAYEVLSDPDKRREFDRGDDIRQSHIPRGGGGPGMFHQGGHTFTFRGGQGSQGGGRFRF